MSLLLGVREREPRPAPRLTQEQRLLQWLSDGDFHCGSEFLEGRFYTFSQRASNVNAREPGRILSRPCQQHEHKLHEYADAWIREPKQMGLLDEVRE